MNDIGTIAKAFFEGRYAEAVEMAEQRLRIHPDEADSLSLQGLSLAALRRTEEAVSPFQRLVEIEPEQADHWLNLGNALRESGNLPAAIRALVSAAARGASGPEFDLDIGLAYLQENRLQEAAMHLESAVGGMPDNVHPRVYLARAYSELGKRDEVLRLLSSIPVPQISDPDALNHLGIVLNQAGQGALAEQVLRKSLQLDPGLHEARQTLSSMYERQNRLDEARRELQELPEHAATAALPLIRARIAGRDGDFVAALAHFDDAETVVADERLLIDLHFDRGKIHDSMGNHEAAMHDFRLAHQASVALLNLHYPGLATEAPPDDWGKTGDFVAPAGAVGYAVPDDGLPADPVFVVGFPRSGTTLLEQLLDAHPALQSMDEQLAVESVIEELRRLGHRYPEELDALGADTITMLRRAYWREVDKAIKLSPNSRLVDKYPFNAVRLPLIARVFPNAKVIMLLRHPADACLSCYMQKFRLNIGTRYWATLESTTALYAQMMSTWLDHSRAIPLPIHTLRYEDLVADMPGRMRDLFKFLDLPWDESVLGYAERARQRGRISTPSYAQVVEPIYSKAIGRWRNYENYLRPHMPALRPFIHRFGYDDGVSVPRSTGAAS